MKNLTLALSLMCATQAFAYYQDGQYNCAHTDPTIPANVYIIKTIDLGGVSAPFVEIVSNMASDSGVQTYRMKGFATVQTNKTTMLRLGNYALEFNADGLVGCKAQ